MGADAAGGQRPVGKTPGTGLHKSAGTSLNGKSFLRQGHNGKHGLFIGKSVAQAGIAFLNFRRIAQRFVFLSRPEIGNAVQCLIYHAIFDFQVIDMQMQDSVAVMSDFQNIYDDIYIVTDEEAIQTAKDLAAKEGIMCGISSGTNVAAALKLAEKLGEGKTVVTILPDTAERYFSTPLFEE